MTDHAMLLPAVRTEDLELCAESLARDGYLRIHSALCDTAAGALEAHVQDELVWNLTLRQGEKVWDATPADQVMLGEQRLLAMAAAGATSGFRFLFDVVRVSADPGTRFARGLLLDKLAEAWSSPAALATWRTVCGRDDIDGLEMLASRYRPGHFLNTHDDAQGQCSERVAAFVLPLSPVWRADWGGLLQLMDSDGNVEVTLTPKRNFLTLFTVPRKHNVSMVTPFAPAPRFSITGWFLASGRAQT